MKNIYSYLQRSASKPISIIVLVGCLLITGVLVFTAMQANALGEKLSIGSDYSGE